MQQIRAFQLSRSPVLNAWYRLYDPQHGLRPAQRAIYERYSPEDDYPVIFVSWFDAWAFCLWSRWDGRSCRLPWENQWEYAAKYGTPWDQAYWWGEQFDPLRCNASPTGVERTTPPSADHANPATRCLDPTGCGLQDMLGNVWEWCQDCYRSQYEQTAADDPGDTPSARVLRGGSWDDRPGDVRSGVRFRRRPTNVDGFIGFRVARALP